LYSNFFGAAIVNISMALFYQLNGKVVKLIKIIRCVQLIGPFKAQPFYILFYAVNILYVFLYRVGIVKTQVSFTVIFLCESKVKAYGFRVPNMQVAVRLRRETG
jgi:hypothetical protein